MSELIKQLRHLQGTNPKNLFGQLADQVERLATLQEEIEAAYRERERHDYSWFEERVFDALTKSKHL